MARTYSLGLLLLALGLLASLIFVGFAPAGAQIGTLSPIPGALCVGTLRDAPPQFNYYQIDTVYTGSEPIEIDWIALGGTSFYRMYPNQRGQATDFNMGGILRLEPGERFTIYYEGGAIRPATSITLELVDGREMPCSLTHDLRGTATPTPSLTPEWSSVGGGMFAVPPTITPFPTLPMPPESLIRVNHQSPDTYLLIEFWAEDVGYGSMAACGFVTGDGAIGGLWLTEDDPPVLRIWPEYLDFAVDLDDLRGFMSVGGNLGGNLGFSAGSLTYPIYAIPANYYPRREAWYFRVLGIDEMGTIAVDVWGERAMIAPGQQWGRVTEQPRGECLVVTTYTLTNFGLLDRSQIELVEDERN